VLVYLGLILCILLIAGSLSKIGIIAMALITSIYLMRKKLVSLQVPNSAKYLLFAITIMLPIFLVFLAFMAWLPYPYLVNRGALLSLYAELITKNPSLLFSGTGFELSAATLLANSSKISQNVFIGNGLTVDVPHNSILLVILEFGVIPALVIFTLIISSIRRYFSQLSRWQKLALLSLFALVAGFDHLLLY